MILGCAVALVSLVVGAARAADLAIRVDAHDVAARRVHTDLTIAVKPGPLTLVYAKWIPGEHGPTGPIESLIGLEIKAGGERLVWTRDPFDMFALRLTVPEGIDHLQMSLDSGLPTEGRSFTEGPTNSAQLAVISWNEFLLFPKGVDADAVSVEASLLAPAGWTVVSALDPKAGADGAYAFETSSLARLIDSPVQMGLHAKLIDLQGAAPGADIRHHLSLMADSAEALQVPSDFAAAYGRLVGEDGA
jgi:hypothetical protein